jgi:flagellar hook assembly protein FlgD
MVQTSNVMNYPNPFASNEGTTFRYNLPHDSFVTIRIFNTAGTFLRNVIEDAARSSGTQEDRWDGNDEHGNPVSFGMYIYSITTTPMLDEDNASTISKILLVK